MERSWSWQRRTWNRGNRGGRTGVGRGRGAGRESAYAVGIVQQTQPSTSTGETQQTVIPRLILEQVQQLMSLLETPKGGYENLSSNITWLIDSGASTHRMANADLLTKCEEVSPVIIDLPNGECTISKRQGSVNLAGKLNMSNVLHVPSLNCNLMSVHKLCKDLKCTVTFDDVSCVLQDCNTRTPIGVGEQ